MADHLHGNRLVRVLDDLRTLNAELQRSARSAVEATERAPEVDTDARAAQVAELDAELAAVSTLREQTRAEVRATMAAIPGGPGER